jgi:transcriptional antiterminator/mannitol/fructose-specific phosphotransferase system IIA component (Ntr-type)
MLFFTKSMEEKRMLDERSRLLIEKLVERPMIETHLLMEQNAITKRQLEYSIDKLNAFLSAAHQATIKNDGAIISLSSESRKYFIDLMLSEDYTSDYIMSSTERQKYIFLMLFYYNDTYLSMQHFLEILNVGKTTFSNDLKKLETELSLAHLSISYSRKEGYSLVGDEFAIRYYLMKLIILDFSTSTQHFLYDYFIETNHLMRYADVEATIETAMQEYQIHFVENRKKEFVYTFLLLLPRLKKDCTEFYQKYNFSVFLEMKEYAFAVSILNTFDAESKYSSHYVCAWILGISVGKLEPASSDTSIIKELVERITTRFEMLSGIRFKNSEQVIRQLFNHFRPTYYRLFFKLPIVNPLFEKIKVEYQELYNIVSETMKPISALFEYKIPEEEIAFLTIHFASLINDFDELQVRQKVALIVCPNGIGSSSIVYTELMSTFPEFIFIGPVETNALNKLDTDVDVIFTTVPNIRLYSTKKPVYVVNPIMNTEEKYNLIRDVYTEIGSLTFKLPSVNKILAIIEKNATIKNKLALEKELYQYLTESDKLVQETSHEGPRLGEIIDLDCIQLNVKARNWREAIYVAASPMVQKAIITRNYVEKIIQTAQNEGPYMLISKHVALPHARPSDGALQLGLGITTLATPLDFDSSENNPVKYIFTLSAVDNTKHINAIADLVQLLDDQDFFQLLDQQPPVSEIAAYIRRFFA